MKTTRQDPILFSFLDHPLRLPLKERIDAEEGTISQRSFPDGESYLRVDSKVEGGHCIVLADLSYPDSKYLPLIFLVDTLRELGAASIGLVAPYLCYMRQDKRFIAGEAITSKLFAADLCQHIDWLVTVDPHLHRYRSLDEVYSIPNRVVQGAPALAQWLKLQKNLLLIGPDAESEQWVSNIANISQHDYAIGEKQRLGDRNVQVKLPDLSRFKSKTAVIIDDVISSGHTIKQCIAALKMQKFESISCVAVHGIFADASDQLLLESGLQELITTNTVAHQSNRIDVSDLLVVPIEEMLGLMTEKQR